MIGSNTYKDGVLQGIVVTPVTEEPVEIRYIGPPIDLMKVACFLGLEPTEDQNPENPVLELKDSRGGYATLQPAERASDLIQTIVAFAQEMGEGNPFA